METSEARRETSRERSVNSSNREHGSKKTSNRPSVIQSRPKKWETSGDRCKNKHPDKCIQSRQRKHLIGPQDPEGDKRKSMQPEHPECIGDQERQVGDKCKSMQPEHPECIGDRERQGGGKPEYRRQGRQVGDKCTITRPEQQSVLETGRRGRQVTSGRQV